MTAPERKLVEYRAMELAKRWLRDNLFEFKDVSASESCDFRAFRGGEEWVIEVKGTTGGPASILLTRNEVELHRRSFPRNALIVVHGIELVRAMPPSAGGGEVMVLAPWAITEEQLQPICYEYRLGSSVL